MTVLTNRVSIFVYFLYCKPRIFYQLISPYYECDNLKFSSDEKSPFIRHFYLNKSTLKTKVML